MSMSSRSPCEAQQVMSTETICSRIDTRSCRLHGETFLFEVGSVSIVADRPGYTVLEIAAFRQTASGPALAATIRVTAAFHELERVPALLPSVLEEWLLRTAAPATRVH